MTDLKLAAIDEEDLAVLSAQVQDAVLTVGDIAWQPKAGRLVLAVNRFAWDNPHGFFRRGDERRRAVLQFDRVRHLATTGIDRSRRGSVLEILALRFLPGARPSGTVEITCAGSAALRLDVECIEARLTDLGARWRASSRPQHGT